MIEPPLGDAADNLTVSYDNESMIDDMATHTQYALAGLVTRDDVRIKLNGGGSETVDDLDSLGPYNLIFDGSNRSGGANTLNVPLARPGFFASMSTDANDDPALKVIGGLVSFHGSTTTDRMNVSDDVPADATGDLTDTFDIDDGALQGTILLTGNVSATAPGGDTFEVTDTPVANLTTVLVGGTGANVFDIAHTFGLNENIVIGGGSGSNTLVLDRIFSSPIAPDSISMGVGYTDTDQLLIRYLAVTGTGTSIQVTGVNAIDVKMYGGTLDAEDLSQLGTFAVDVTGEESRSSDPNEVIIEPPPGGVPDNVTVQGGTSIQDTATGTNYSITGLAAEDDVRVKLNGCGSETVDNLQTLGPYTLIFDGSGRSGGGNMLEVPLTSADFNAYVVTDAVGDPEIQVGGGLVSFHGSDPADQINVTDDVATGSTDGFTVTDDSALEGTLDLVGNQSPSGLDNDDFNVYNTATAKLLTELTGGTGRNVFDIIHGGANQNIAITGGVSGGLLILDRPQSSVAAPDSLTLSATSIRRGPPDAVAITGSATSITASGIDNISVNMYGGTLDAGDLGQIAPFISVEVTAESSPSGDPNHVIIESPVNTAPDDMTVLNNDGLLVKDLATNTFYTFYNLTAQGRRADQAQWGRLRDGRQPRRARAQRADL